MNACFITWYILCYETWYKTCYITCYVPRTPPAPSSPSWVRIGQPAVPVYSTVTWLLRSHQRRKERTKDALLLAVVMLMLHREERVPADDDSADDWKAHVANDVNMLCNLLHNHSEVQIWYITPRVWYNTHIHYITQHVIKHTIIVI
jgi:hypothetical protein